MCGGRIVVVRRWRRKRKHSRRMRRVLRVMMRVLREGGAVGRVFLFRPRRQRRVLRGWVVWLVLRAGWCGALSETSLPLCAANLLVLSQQAPTVFDMLVTQRIFSSPPTPSSTNHLRPPPTLTLQPRPHYFLSSRLFHDILASIVFIPYCISLSHADTFPARASRSSSHYVFVIAFLFFMLACLLEWLLIAAAERPCFCFKRCFLFSGWK